MKDSLRTEGEEKAAWGNVLNTNPDAISLFTVSALLTISLWATTECDSSLQFNNKTKWWIVQVISNRVSSKHGCIIKETIWHAHATWWTLACHSFSRCHLNTDRCSVKLLSCIPWILKQVLSIVHWFQTLPPFSWGEFAWCDIFTSGIGMLPFLVIHSPAAQTFYALLPYTVLQFSLKCLWLDLCC